MQPLQECVAGVDFGSDMVRVSVVEADSGRMVYTASRAYRRWAQGHFCDPARNLFRQHPLDHLEALEGCFSEVRDALGPRAVGALAVDSTGSTPVPVNRQGVALSLLPEWAVEPDAMFWLWKDHTSVREAAEIDLALGAGDPDFTIYQGRYSSEWWWAKILNAVRSNELIRQYAYTWVEHSDWVANLLVGVTDADDIVRNSCAAGHKALYNTRLGGLPPRDVLEGLDSHLARIVDTYRLPPAPAGTSLGVISQDWAERLHLSTDTIVGMGSLDAHAGAVGAGVGPRALVKVMGTSTVDMFVLGYDDLSGVDTRLTCGLAEDSIIPGMLGGEAGQAAFGDLFGWFADTLRWPLLNIGGGGKGATAEALSRGQILTALEAAASQRPPTRVAALDWLNGRRYPNGDETATAALTQLSMGVDAVDIYQALVDAAVLGSKNIYESLMTVGVDLRRAILVGGIAEKSPYICQAVADALGIPVMVSEESEACAKGAAMFAAVARGHFASLPEAQASWCPEFRTDHEPSQVGAVRYEQALERYKRLGSSLNETVFQFV